MWIPAEANYRQEFPKWKSILSSWKLWWQFSYANEFFSKHTHELTLKEDFRFQASLHTCVHTLRCVWLPSWTCVLFRSVLWYLLPSWSKANRSNFEPFSVACFKAARFLAASASCNERARWFLRWPAVTVAVAAATSLCFSLVVCKLGSFSSSSSSFSSSSFSRHEKLHRFSRSLDLCVRFVDVRRRRWSALLRTT